MVPFSPLAFCCLRCITGDPLIKVGIREFCVRHECSRVIFSVTAYFPHDYGKVTSTRPKSCIETSRGKELCSLTNKAYFGTIDHAQAISCDILPYPTAPKAHKMGEGGVKSQPTRSFLPSFLHCRSRLRTVHFSFTSLEQVVLCNFICAIKLCLNSL